MTVVWALTMLGQSAALAVLTAAAQPADGCPQFPRSVGCEFT
ncbi:MAG: hypothetical protein R6V57_09940 [Vicinamibacterales bacterium]